MKNRSFEVLCHKQIQNARSKRCPDRASGHTIGERWNVGSSKARSLTLVNVFHPDNIFRYYMLSSGWSYAGQHWAAFPLGEAGQPCVLRVIRERGPYTLHTQTVPLAQHSSVHPGKNSVCRHFTSGYLTSEWERRTFQLLRSNISGSSGSAYPVRHAQLYCSPEAS